MFCLFIKDETLLQILMSLFSLNIKQFSTIISFLFSLFFGLSIFHNINIFGKSMPIVFQNAVGVTLEWDLSEGLYNLQCTSDDQMYEDSKLSR